MAQLVTRIDARLVDAVDELVATGVVTSRSDAVRVALQRFVDWHRRDRIGREIVDAYRRMPQTEDELGWTDESARRMIADEPW